MLVLSSAGLAIRIAREIGTLRVVERTGRLGQYWAIEDDHGIIEVALSAAEAERIVNA